MKTLKPQIQDELVQVFGPRVTFDPVECMFYSHDVGSLPSLIKPLVGNTRPAGVVQPRAEQDLVRLAALARTHGVPLVPRGKSTSGYGGVLPVRGGLVVDFAGMNQIEAVDAEAMTVTVQPGVVWEKLEKALRKHGLALRTYPSSAPSSTVGGWLAQGGVGFGAYEYGAFRDNVVSCRVVLPDGQVRDLAGEELDLVSDAEGITGFIVSVTLAVRRAESEAVWGARFDTPEALAGALRAIRQAGLPLWSVNFINPRMAELKNQLPPRLEHGHPVHEHRPEVPAAYVAVVVAPESRRGEVEARLSGLVQAAGGQMVDLELAQHEWDERFDLMHVKRLGPSLAPAEVVVPLDGLDKALAAIEEHIALPMVMRAWSMAMAR